MDSYQLLTMRQAADLLGLSTRTIFSLRAAGKIPTCSVGGKSRAVRIRRGDLEDYIESCRYVPAQPEQRAIDKRQRLDFVLKYFGRYLPGAGLPGDAGSAGRDKKAASPATG